MNFVSLVLALATSAAAAGSLVTLFLNVAGACSAMISLLAVLAFTVCSVATAYFWVKALNLKITPQIKYSKV